MLQVDSVLQKRKKYSRNIRKRNVCGIKKTVSFFRAVKNRCGFFGRHPFIGLQRLCRVDCYMSTFLHVAHCMNCKMYLHYWMGFIPFFYMKKRLTVSFQFPVAASVWGTPFLFVKTKRCWTVRRGWYEHFLRLHVATISSSTLFRVTLPPEGWHARGERCPCCGERRHPEASCMASMTYRNKTTFPARLMIFEHVE